MKLPKYGDKFVITEKTSLFYGNVVSGVHLEIWGSEDYPDKLFYHVRVNQAYGGDIISCYGGFVCAFLTLKEALEYVSHYLTPYQEQEEKPDEEPAAKAVDSVDPGVVTENMVFDQSRSGTDGNDSRGFAGNLCSSDSAGNSSDQMPREDVIPEAAAALDHVFNRFNSLAADLLHMQHIFTPAQSGTGGAAYA